MLAATALRWGAAGAVAQVVDVEVRVGASSTASETTQLTPSVATICAGTTLFVDVWVMNAGAEMPGIAGGSVDVVFDPRFVSVEQIEHGTLFDQLVTGMVDGTLGVINDVGGITLESGAGVAPTWGLLAHVRISAIDEGPAWFSLAPGAFRFALAGGRPPLEFGDDVALGASQLVDVGGPMIAGDLNCDTYVTLTDYASFLFCFEGAVNESGVCVFADLNGDGMTDLADFAHFQNAFSER
jgi:hypothetical protein